MEKELYKFKNKKYEIHGYIIDKIPSDIEIYKEYGDLEDEDITNIFCQNKKNCFDEIKSDFKIINGRNLKLSAI